MVYLFQWIPATDWQTSSRFSSAPAVWCKQPISIRRDARVADQFNTVEVFCSNSGFIRLRHFLLLADFQKIYHACPSGLHFDRPNRMIGQLKKTDEIAL